MTRVFSEAIVIAENGSVVELERGRTPRIVDRIEVGVTFVDGLGVGDVQDVACATAVASPRTAVC